MFGSNWTVPSGTRQNFREKRSRYAVLIPVLNEGERIRSQLIRMRELAFDHDLFIVDGGSGDGSLEQGFLREQNVAGLIVKTGHGKLSAQLRLGLAHLMNDGYEGVVLIDGNNKDNPAAIPSFVEGLENGFDHIQGSRFIPGGRAENTPLSRLIGIKTLHAPLVSFAAGFRYTDTTNGFRAYSRRFLLDPRVAPFREVFEQYELHYYLAIRAAQLRFRVCELPVERVYPKGSKVPTKISPLKGNLLVLQTLLRACLGFYEPDRKP